ncbi:MAG: hypothetical protein ABW046_13790 [Actinoplanes sp.]
MTEDDLRAADPYRPGLIGRLDGEKQALLEEIMADTVVETTHKLRRRLVGAVAAAIVLTGAIVVAYPDREPPPAAKNVEKAKFSPAAIQAAEQNPRLLIKEPGWKAVNVYGFAEEDGSISFVQGSLRLDMNWYPAGQHDFYQKDRQADSQPTTMTVAGLTGDLYSFKNNYFSVMLPPRDNTFVEIGTTSKGWTRARWDQVLGSIVRVDAETWLAALPPEIVTPDRAPAAAAKALAGVPLPPGFDVTVLNGDGANDAYQFGVRVTSAVGCAWIKEWERADRADDAVARAKAAKALRSSRQWKVLKDIEDGGGWSSVFWGVTEEVADGHVPDGYADTIGCN